MTTAKVTSITGEIWWLEQVEEVDVRGSLAAGFSFVQIGPLVIQRERLESVFFGVEVASLPAFTEATDVAPAGLSPVLIPHA